MHCPVSKGECIDRKCQEMLLISIRGEDYFTFVMVFSIANAAGVLFKRYWPTTDALRIVTGSLGTSWNIFTLPVGTFRILSTMSIPSITFPNTA